MLFYYTVHAQLLHWFKIIFFFIMYFSHFYTYFTILITHVILFYTRLYFVLYLRIHFACFLFQNSKPKSVYSIREILFPSVIWVQVSFHYSHFRKTRRLRDKIARIIAVVSNESKIIALLCSLCMCIVSEYTVITLAFSSAKKLGKE